MKRLIAGMFIVCYSQFNTFNSVGHIGQISNILINIAGWIIFWNAYWHNDNSTKPEKEGK